MQRIQFSEPNVVIDNIDRFYIARSYPDGDLPNERLCFRGMITKGRLDDNIKATETNERLLCVQLLNLKHEMENHSAPLLHVANVYTTLRFYDMDEDRLKELVKTLGIEDFAARLMVVLQNVMRLSEGFMPFVAKDDKQRKICKENSPNSILGQALATNVHNKPDTLYMRYGKQIRH